MTVHELPFLHRSVVGFPCSAPSEAGRPDLQNRLSSFQGRTTVAAMWVLDYVSSMNVKIVGYSVSAASVLSFGFLISGCGVGQDDPVFIQGQSTFYGATKVEKTDISVTMDGKLRWLVDGNYHEKILTPRETELLETEIRQAKFAEMDRQYGKAVADGGFRRMVVQLDGASHEVILFPNAVGVATYGKQEQDLKNFKEVWDHLLSLGARESLAK